MKLWTIDFSQSLLETHIGRRMTKKITPLMTATGLCAPSCLASSAGSLLRSKVMSLNCSCNQRWLSTILEPPCVAALLDFITKISENLKAQIQCQHTLKQIAKWMSSDRAGETYSRTRHYTFWLASPSVNCNKANMLSKAHRKCKGIEQSSKKDGKAVGCMVKERLQHWC